MVTVAPRWWEARMVSVDVETTAADPEEARIVTAAMALCGGGYPAKQTVLLANPGVEIPAEATAIHGISTARAKAKGMPIAEAVAAVVEILERQVSRGRALVTFNSRYDLTVLDREARRHGVKPLMERVQLLLVVDPFVIDRHLDRYRKGSRKLADMCAHYGVVHDAAHDAAADALATARLAWVMGARAPVVRRVRDAGEERELAALTEQWEQVRHDLRALHEAQMWWSKWQSQGLAEHFEDTGAGDPMGVAFDWPVTPMRGRVSVG